VLAGPDEYGHLRQLESVIASLGLGHRVILPGLVRGEDKLRWLHHARAFVLPSSGEGLSVAMLEAMGCRLPCIISSGCNYPEMARREAGYVLPLEESSWAAAMEELISNDSKRQRMGARAREAFEE